MNLETIFGKSIDEPVRAGLVGVGEFGTTFLAQARYRRGLSVPVVCDLDVLRAREVLIEAGVNDQRIAICESRARALSALEAGNTVIVSDAKLLAELPIDVVLEATGEPEVAAATIIAAQDGGKHTVIATKEAEIIAGPLFARRAAAAGLVHTLVDGDQPSLLVGLISWSQILGFKVVAAGKSTEADFVWDAEAGTITAGERTRSAPNYRTAYHLSDSDIIGSVKAREMLNLPRSRASDLCEIGIVANHTGLKIDRPDLHAPVSRVADLPSIFRPKESGGILSNSGVVDLFNCLRRPEELSFAGGVFVCVEIPDAATGRLFASKGTLASPDGRFLLMYNPIHLLGVEAPISVLLAKRLKATTGGARVNQNVDLVARARRDLIPGEVLAMGSHTSNDSAPEDRHSIAALEHLLLPAKMLGPSAPIPYYLAAGKKVVRPVSAGSVLNCEHVDIGEDSLLFRLRKEQDRYTA